jgi:hypothetical protein
MITIILSLIIFNFLAAELATYLLLTFCKKVGENPSEFLIFFNPDTFEWVRYINANPDYVKKSSFPHLPIVNILICLILFIALLFIKPKKN